MVLRHNERSRVRIAASRYSSLSRNFDGESLSDQNVARRGGRPQRRGTDFVTAKERKKKRWRHVTSEEMVMCKERLAGSFAKTWEAQTKSLEFEVNETE